LIELARISEHHEPEKALKQYLQVLELTESRLNAEETK